MSPAAPPGNGRSGGQAPREKVNATARRIAVVPHTHWDREWYDPFQTFRLKLVRLIDGLLDLMERDSSYSHFLLDGQVAVIDDYLEIRPENEERLRALTVAGRISVGPWYILMDEFLVSGETLVRNLQTGIRRAGAFGGAMNVGYLPDMFGHVAQMPQLLASAGFEDAVVWRGVPSAADGSAFCWRSPDGSSVRAEYLVAGYGNGAALPEDAKALVRRLHAQVEEFGTFLDADGPILLMNGSDHLRPQPWLGRVVAEANQIQDEFELAITSLPEYLAGASRDHLPEWRGELRSGWRSNLLMGVASNRVDVKQAAGRAERALEQMAEPLSALFLPPEAWPAPFLDLAWKLVIRNSAHDSICACSADDVVDARGRAVLPGFVDSHAHLVFAGERGGEFAARMAGQPYTAGGIASTVTATRAASDVTLRAGLRRLADELLRQGTTTYECKSGYGLTVRDEARSVMLAAEVTPEVTFLGAHVVPPEFDGDPAGYLDLVCGPMLDACAPNARWIDVFCEKGAFGADEAAAVLAAGRARGLLPRVHANQLGPGPGVRVAVEAGAASADHCTYLTSADVDLLASARTVATLLPGVEFSCRQPYPDARRLLGAGVTVAIATDCNPGSCFTSSMALCVALAVREMGMTTQEAVWSATAGGARALRRADVGHLGVGARADLLMLDAPSHIYLAYRPGVPLTAAVWRDGRLAAARPQILGG